MSGAITATQVIAAATLAGTAYSMYTGQRQASAQKDAARKAESNAAATAKAADEASNRANSKRPNTQAMLDQALMGGKAGTAGTMLTGPGGVDLAQLQLGRSTLLGM